MKNKKISNGWQIKRLGAIFDTSAGGTPLKSCKHYYQGGAVPWIRSGEVCQKDITESELCITESGLKNSSAKIFPNNTVLIAMYGATAGQVGILRFASATNQAVCGIFPNQSMLPEFLYFFLLLKKEEILKQAVGNAQPNISQEKIKNIEVAFPPIEEQKRIVGILDEVFEGVAKAKENVEGNLRNVREVFEAYLQSVFTAPSKNWEICDLGNYVKFIDYRGRTPHKTAQGMRLITAKNVKNGFIQLTPEEFVNPDIYDSWMTRGIPKKGDILFTTEAPLANVAQLDTDEKVVFAQRIIILQPDSKKLDQTFLKYLLVSNPIRQEILSKGTGATVQGIKASLLKKIKIYFPKSLSEQKSIVTKLDALSTETKKLEAIYKTKLNHLEELKKSILKKAFNGEL